MGSATVGGLRDLRYLAIVPIRDIAIPFSTCTSCELRAANA
jgi:hypothetical protein